MHRLVDTATLDGVENQIRLERLAARLAERGPLAVRHTEVRHAGQRETLHLDDDTVLSLRLFWARTSRVAALCSVRWDDRVGWILVVRTTAGARRIDYAWLAELTPAAA
jgi:hypothetical protein